MFTVYMYVVDNCYFVNIIIIIIIIIILFSSQAVGHYTLAGIYLSCGDLVATNLHLRIVLNHQPNFKHALSALKLVRCSLKFRQEQKVLEQKVGGTSCVMSFV